MKQTIYIFLFLVFFQKSVSGEGINMGTDTSLRFFPISLSSLVDEQVISPQNWDKLNLYFSNKLNKIDEPVLRGKSDLNVIRFTCLGAMNNSISIRVTKDDQKIKLIVKSIVEFPLQEHVRDTTIDLSIKQWCSLVKLFNKVDFYNQPELIDDIGKDGAFWILEANSIERNYHFMSRWSPKKNNRFRKCCEFLLSLSGVRLKKEMY